MCLDAVSATKVSPQKFKLKQHEKIHTGQKPYEFGLCGKCFAREDYVKIHMKTHGAVPNLLPSLNESLYPMCCD